jgi:hypothetical protein
LLGLKYIHSSMKICLSVLCQALFQVPENSAGTNGPKSLPGRISPGVHMCGDSDRENAQHGTDDPALSKKAKILSEKGVEALGWPVPRNTNPPVPLFTLLGSSVVEMGPSTHFSFLPHPRPHEEPHIPAMPGCSPTSNPKGTFPPLCLCSGHPLSLDSLLSFPPTPAPLRVEKSNLLALALCFLLC